jgi:hypothetical protein
MPDTLILETFAPHLGTAFTVTMGSDETLQLSLDELKPLGHGVPGGREPFALLFHHEHLPREAHLPQGTYHLHHTSLGSLDLFLVPLGPDAQGMRYEAIFT